MSNEPPMSASAQDSVVHRPVNYGFIEGGDLTLRSRDNVDFSVLSVLLSLASPVLAGMITVNGTRQDLVDVSERAETVALMLKFIYPVQPPAISSFQELGEALGAAETYNLEAMKSRLRQQMAAPDEPVSISADPLRAWVVADCHGLREESDTAMSLALKRYDFPQACMPRLSRDFNSAYTKLIGVPLAKLYILKDVLFSFHKEPMRLTSETCRWTLCEFCAGMYFNSKRRSAPEWQALWADSVFTQLKGLPVHKWGPIFKIDFFNAVLRHNGEESIRFPGSHGICTCPDSINQSPAEFEQWTASVHEYLKERVIPALLGDVKGYNWVGYGPFNSLADSLRESASFEPWQL